MRNPTAADCETRYNRYASLNLAYYHAVSALNITQPTRRDDPERIGRLRELIDRAYRHYVSAYVVWRAQKMLDAEAAQFV